MLWLVSLIFTWEKKDHYKMIIKRSAMFFAPYQATTVLDIKLKYYWWWYSRWCKTILSLQHRRRQLHHAFPRHDPSVRQEGVTKPYERLHWRLNYPSNPTVKANLNWLLHQTCQIEICKISVRRSKHCLEFSIAWGPLQISRWPFHSCAIFESYLINSLRFSEA